MSCCWPPDGAVAATAPHVSVAVGGFVSAMESQGAFLDPKRRWFAWMVARTESFPEKAVTLQSAAGHE